MLYFRLLNIADFQSTFEVFRRSPERKFTVFYAQNLTPISNYLSFCWGAILHNAQAQSSPFITRWDLSKTGGAATTLTFGVATAGTVSYTWQQVGGAASGSGTFNGSTLTITGLPANAIIDVSIGPTNFQRININNGTDRERLMEIKQWGTVAWTGMQYAFYGCSNMTLTATDTPNFTAVTNMSSMFRNCSSFNQSVSNFNTTAVTNMSGMFYGCYTFNQSVSNFNTAAVTNMLFMFTDCLAFNQSVSSFNTAAVTDMSYMFFRCGSFNQSVSNFNIAAVTNMSSMFSNWGTAFNQSLAAWGSQLNANVDLSNFLDNCGMSVANYDATLKAFAAGTVTGISMGATGLKYCSAETARTLLTTPIASGGKGWSISGDSKNCTSPIVLTITPERSAICPGASVTLTASGCAGTVTWVGGPSPQTGSSVSVSPAVTTSYSANCSTGGTETVTVKVATNTVAVGYDVITDKERFRAVTTLTSAKKVGHVTFTPSANVVYEAGNAITLLPGFTAEKSSTFQAEIKTCL
ncbi:BspA family leucine-rich repeat surface protein [Runella slithyformis]|uniref:Lipoprotein n=1 Tax=Runella slithyformis (strain ATCC 29530 / DSM 19594 / LMG 11500 / NCIMB 11436 / LSU 4) TaxID=761193 RepID=A0A7U3ZHI9_RUNSL|nr:BspA family leucine-rich repeat surface protein [Runella slithyformis]AEI47344.1 lipoprotein [Runella slithyformis DSM 19594]